MKRQAHFTAPLLWVITIRPLSHRWRTSEFGAQVSQAYFLPRAAFDQYSVNVRRRSPARGAATSVAVCRVSSPSKRDRTVTRSVQRGENYSLYSPVLVFSFSQRVRCMAYKSCLQRLCDCSGHFPSHDKRVWNLSSVQFVKASMTFKSVWSVLSGCKL